MNIKPSLAILCLFLLVGCIDREVLLSDYRTFNIEHSSLEKVLFGNYSIMLPKKLHDYEVFTMIKENRYQRKVQTSQFPNSVWQFPAFLIEVNPSVDSLGDKIDKPHPTPDDPFCLQKLLIDHETYWQFYPSYDSMRYNYFLLNDGEYRLRVSFSYELKLSQKEIYQMLASVQKNNGNDKSD